MKLLQQFGNLEGVLKPENQDAIRKMGKKYAQVPEQQAIVRLAFALTSIPRCDNHPQLNEIERAELSRQLWASRESNRFDFVGLAEQWELTRVMQKLDVLFRPQPTFEGFEQWFPKPSP